MKWGYMKKIIKLAVCLIKKKKDWNTLWDICFINFIKNLGVTKTGRVVTYRKFGNTESGKSR